MTQKKSFVFYLDNYTEAMKGLSYEDKGKIFDAIVNHAGGIADKPELGMLGLAVDPIKGCLDRDLVKYEKKCEANRRNGKKGGRPTIPDGSSNNPNNPDGSFGNPAKAKKPDNDNGSDNDSDNKKEKKDTIPYGDIISFLNEKAGKSYKATTPKTRDFIKARFKEGFTLEDFKKVITGKVGTWLNDPEWSKYLRPETLFGNKFEGYLNEKKPSKGGGEWY